MRLDRGKKQRNTRKKKHSHLREGRDLLAVDPEAVLVAAQVALELAVHGVILEPEFLFVCLVCVVVGCEQGFCNKRRVLQQETTPGRAFELIGVLFAQQAPYSHVGHVLALTALCWVGGKGEEGREEKRGQ